MGTSKGEGNPHMEPAHVPASLDMGEGVAAECIDREFVRVT